MKKSYIFAVIAVFLWGTMATVVKLVLAEIPNLQALSISSFIATIFLLLVNLCSDARRKWKCYSIKQYFEMSLLGFLGMFLYSAFYYYGIGQLTAQEACILNYLWPIMLVVFSCIILREKLSVKKIVAIVMSFVGIAVLSLGNHEVRTGNYCLGILSCIGAAICYGLFSVLNKKKNMDQNIMMPISWLTVSCCALILGRLTEDWVVIKGMQWFGIVWLGVCTSALAYLLWAIALRDAEDTAKIANLAYLTPFISILFSAVFLKEKIKWNAILALIFIVGGILLQNVNIKSRDQR